MVLLTLAPDQTVDSLVAEIRALRVDLRSTAAALQRVQIMMYRLQAQAAFVEKATGRLDMARAQCNAVENERRHAAAQIEQIKKQNSQNEAEQKGVEALIAQFQANMELAASEAQQCLGEQADAEAQFRLEQAKMSELENQLEGLDRALAGK
jgi:chromosome segregation ATPase